MTFVNEFLNLKSKHIIKGAIGQIEKKQGKITCESNSSEDCNMNKTKIKPNFSSH